MASAQHLQFTVPADASGTRLDKWLAGVVTALSRARLQALIADGHVQVQARIAQNAAYRVKAGDVVAVTVPAAEDAEPAAQAMDLVVVYEDDAVIVIDKPAGLVVHPAPGNPDRTLVNALLAHCGESLLGIGGVKRPGIVHRIDKDTSGLLVIAKTESAHASLSAQFKAHTTERRYEAFVWGVPRPASGVITGAIGRSASNRKKMAIVPRGRAAETHYSLVARFGDLAAQVSCRLTTGRTHQIRVHMASLGHGLIGDRTYGRPRATGRIDPPHAAYLKAFPRQALHAAILGFVHPVSGEALRFDAPLPADLAMLQKMLKGAA